MAGFFGLFSRKTKYVDEPTVNAGQPTDAYYLKPDDAKTFGNIEFMRKPNTIGRTFPKTASSQKGAEVIRQVSLMELGKMKDNGIVPGSAKPEANANGSGRRSPDDNS